jgi:hypothetical protein
MQAEPDLADRDALGEVRRPWNVSGSSTFQMAWQGSPLDMDAVSAFLISGSGHSRNKPTLRRAGPAAQVHGPRDGWRWHPFSQRV